MKTKDPQATRDVADMIGALLVIIDKQGLQENMELDSGTENILLREAIDEETRDRFVVALVAHWFATQSGHLVSASDDGRYGIAETDVHGLVNLAVMVRETVKMLVDELTTEN